MNEKTSSCYFPLFCKEIKKITHFFLGDIEQKEYTSLTKTASTLYEQGGIKRFFRGWGWRTGRMSAGIFIINECKNRVTPLLFPNYFK